MGDQMRTAPRPEFKNKYIDSCIQEEKKDFNTRSRFRLLISATLTFHNWPTDQPGVLREDSLRVHSFWWNGSKKDIYYSEFILPLNTMCSSHDVTIIDQCTAAVESIEIAQACHPREFIDTCRLSAGIDNNKFDWESNGRFSWTLNTNAPNNSRCIVPLAARWNEWEIIPRITTQCTHFFLFISFVQMC